MLLQSVVATPQLQEDVQSGGCTLHDQATVSILPYANGFGAEIKLKGSTNALDWIAQSDGTYEAALPSSLFDTLLRQFAVNPA